MASNGVCHQAANRILFPADITVMGAHGYGLSESIFGTYGRPSGVLGICHSPFKQYEDIDGEMPECEEPSDVPRFQQGSVASVASTSAQWEHDYIQSVLRIYERYQVNFKASLPDRDLEEFDVEIFLNRVQHVLSEGNVRIERLEEIYRIFDRSRIYHERRFDNIGRSAFDLAPGESPALPVDREQREK